MIEWSDLRFFLAIARTGSLSGAARALAVNQTTVGRRLAALETQVASRLFDRTPEGYVLTAAGEGVLATVEHLETDVIAVERRLSGGDARLEGVVRLAVSDVLATTFLIPHLPGLRLRHPGIELELRTGSAPVDLARREADLALRMAPRPEQPQLVVRKLGETGFFAYAARAYLAKRGRPEVRRGFAGHDLVAYGAELTTIPGARWMTEKAHAGRVVFRANSILSVREAVTAGLGVGVMPCIAGDPVASLSRVSGRVATREMWLVVHPDVQRNARIRAVMVFLTDLMAQEKRVLIGDRS